MALHNAKSGDSCHSIPDNNTHGARKKPTQLDRKSVSANSDGIGDNRSVKSKKQVRLENTHQTGPDNVYNTDLVKRLTTELLTEKLKDAKYDPIPCQTLSREIAAEMMDRLKMVYHKRYKMVTVVSIGSIKEKPGVNLGSRCLWNDKTDNSVSIRFANSDIFAVALIFFLYFE